MTDLAALLHAYGGWGVAAISMAVNVWLFRLYAATQDKRIDEAREVIRLAVEMRGDNLLTVEALKLLDASHKRHR